MIETGRLCIKTAGRDAGKKCVIVEILDNKFVLIDGETRRKKCNQMHLEPLKDKIDIKKGASHADVAAEFKKIGLKARETKPKAKKVRPRRLRRSKLAGQAAAEPEDKKTKKTIQKTAKKSVKKTKKKEDKKESTSEQKKDQKD
ncbi:50S ribosomal protein L14e [Candidatus Woesearchaeota archaeon]|nr:50S ribosomal protein L14e [Candidatus Woesearchaeota archaeon]